MSWFTEIAGKAEDLLNKVDKTTAVVLQNKTPARDYHVKSGFIDRDNKAFYQTVPADSRRYGAPSQPVSKIGSPSQTKVSGLYSGIKKNPVSDDEKLMEYLNSSDPEHRVQRKRNSKLKASIRDTSDVQRLKKDALPVILESVVVNSATAEESEYTLDSHVDTEIRDENPQAEHEPAINYSHHVDEGDSAERTSELHYISSAKEDTTAIFELDQDKHDSEKTSFHQQELLLAKQRAEHSEAEMKRMQRKLEHWNSQISGNDKQVRELLSQELDMIARLDAKDSQLAVLKVRLEEADEELRYKKALLEELKSENERLSQSYNDETLRYNQTIDKLREQLMQSETELSKSHEAYNASQTERLLRVSKMEEEKRHLAENVTSLHRKLTEVNERNKESSSRLQNASHSIDILQKEYADYKQKAQRILQSKEALISSLKKGCLDADKSSCNETSCAVLNAETEGIKQERDLLREELRKASETIECRQNELQELEKIAQNDSDTARAHCRNLEEQLHQERILREEVQLLNKQLKEEILLQQEELAKIKKNLQGRIQDREMEIEKLRKQLVTKSLSTVSQDELESRLHALTENLIQKQTIVEALSTEKNSLVLQLERLEKQLKESQLDDSHLHAVIGVSNSDSDRKQKLPLFMETPFDSTLTRRVKRAYGNIDAFSIRLGFFFRRYPVARLFVFVYMLLLHLWVMIVLLTYEPEAHSPSYKVVNES